jgi:radical SAM protein with 4Fe4S-binding SPASM domain
MKIIWDSKYHFSASFIPETGFYFRTDVYQANGRPAGRDPFMASFPHLLDVGIMGHCEHGLTGLCFQSGVECYQNGMNRSQNNMQFDHFRRIASECSGRVFQFALGGRGDPEMHEDLERILDCCKYYDIVPNMTTSGFGSKPENVTMIKKYCGAAAVSWYRTPGTIKAIDMLLSAGVTTNIHYVVSNSTIAEATSLLENDGFPRGVNRIIFLLHKPVGLGSPENVLHIGDPRVRHFFNLFDNPEICRRAGFDSCSVPGLLNMTSRVQGVSLDTCEGARFSAYITPDMKMLPCSFDQRHKWAVDIFDSTVEQAWDSPTFNNFRENLKNSCPDCSLHYLCLGGCPINKEIVLCGTVNGGGLVENKNRICH